MNRIPYVDLPGQHRALKDELMEAVSRVLDSGWFILGPEVEAFENEVAERLGAAHVIGVNSGTDALLLALRLRGIGEGDEVITVSHSFVATASAIRMVGATPIFVDIDPDTMLIDPNRVEDAVSEDTRAVMPVHLGGMPCDMAPLVELCERHELTLIEDAAQSLGATYQGQAAGTFGIGCFSLHPLKVIGACGDAGMIVVDDDDDAATLRQMRNIGLANRNHCEMIAGNTRIDALQAALLRVKLRHMDDFIAARRAHAAAYTEAFRGLVPLPVGPRSAESVYSTFVIRHPQRDALREALSERGIDAKIHYPLAIHQQGAFADLDVGPLPVTEKTVSEILSLPVTPELDAAGRERVIEATLDALETLG